MSLLNEYAISLKCEKNKRIYIVLHRLAPILKIGAIVMIIPSIFAPIMFFAVGAVLALSVAINYIKWYLIYNYNYIIKDNTLTIQKTYTYIRPKKIAETKLSDISSCQVIDERQINNIPERVDCFCQQAVFNVYLCIKVEDNPKNYILAADNYFYSLLKEKQ